MPRLGYDLVDVLPRGHADRADQLTRSSESVVRNIAEGAGRWSEADSANRYKIARGKAMECAASLDVMKLRKLITEERYERGGKLLEGGRNAHENDRLTVVKGGVHLHVAVAVKVHDHDHDYDHDYDYDYVNAN
ncbi:MAG: four helix bundle protein [Kofleriaceae bacterium]